MAHELAGIPGYRLWPIQSPKRRAQTWYDLDPGRSACPSVAVDKNDASESQGAETTDQSECVRSPSVRGIEGLSCRHQLHPKTSQGCPEAVSQARSAPGNP